MPSKDIFSIHQFQITHQQSQIELYERAYALPEFFTTNLVHDNRIVKAFIGQNAIIKAFYFNYMKLALQSEDSQDYLQLLKEQFLTYDYIKQGQLQDEFLSDFQYRKFFKDFIEIAKQKIVPDFQTTAKKYPIIDQVLEKLFKTVVPAELLHQKNQQQKGTEFSNAHLIIQNLCEKFVLQYSIQIPQKCLKFQSTEIYLYFQNMNEIYIAYIDESEPLNEKINKFQSSQTSSFVCGEGNSFTSKFKESNQNKTKKHPFRQINLQTSGSQKGQKQIKKTESFYLPPNQNSNKTLSKKIDDMYNNTNKIEVLQNKGALIRRRSKNSEINKENQHSKIQRPNSFVELQKQSSNVQVSWQKHEQNKEKDLTNTLINILNIDSRGSLAEEDAIILPSTLIQKAPQKCQLIMRRRTNKQTLDQPLIVKNQLNQFGNDFNSPTQMISQNNEQNNYSDEPISLPEPKQNNQGKFLSSFSSYSMKAPQMQMQEIIELGQDQDSEEMIRNFCEMQQKQHSVKTIHLTDSISRKLNIQQVQSRNINISRTSIIAEQVETPYLNEPKSYQNFQNQKNFKPRNSEDIQLNNASQMNKVDDQKKSFQQYMREMRAKLQMGQKSFMNKPQKMDFNFRKNSSANSNNTKQQRIQPRVENFSKNFTYQNQFGQESQYKPSIKQYQSYKFNWTPTGTDEFTKSNILLLLDEQYRQKIRAIKNQYKSTIKQQQSSLIKSNYKSGIDLKTKSLIKQSQKRKTYNQNQHSSLEYNPRSRQPSIHVQQE